MGLDMYLSKRTYVGAEYEHRNVKGKVEISINSKPIDIKFNRISYIEEAVGYWRKANQIHAWFVTNVQDGEDDCKDYDVSIEQLQELLSLCKKVKESSKLVDGTVSNGYTFVEGERKDFLEPGKVIEDTSTAEELLPAQSGFFFGGTDYDQYYFEDIDNTIEIIEGILKEDNSNADFSYRSSW